MLARNENKTASISKNEKGWFYQVSLKRMLSKIESKIIASQKQVYENENNTKKIILTNIENQ